MLTATQWNRPPTGIGWRGSLNVLLVPLWEAQPDNFRSVYEHHPSSLFTTHFDVGGHTLSFQENMLQSNQREHLAKHENATVQVQRCTNDLEKHCSQNEV